MFKKAYDRRYELGISTILIVFMIIIFLTYTIVEAIPYLLFLTSILVLAWVMVKDQKQYYEAKLKDRIHFSEKKYISDWEENLADLKEFWIITPEFQGEVEDFMEAMKVNLQREVNYLYFLFQYADLYNLARLNKEIVRELNREGKSINGKIEYVYIDVDSHEDKMKDILNAYCYEGRIFLAVKSDTKLEAYNLIQPDEKGEISGGYKVSEKRIKNIHNRFLDLKNSLRPKNIEDFKPKNQLNVTQTTKT